MFGNNFTLFEFLGFRVRANVTWLFLAILVTWSLAAGFLPAAYPGLATATYWSLGFVGMIALFFSLLFHEFSHSLVARTYGLEIRGITLFLFGGVAEMPMEPDNPKTEFWIAIAGPLSSVLLAGMFYVLSLGLAGLPIPAYIPGLTLYLAVLNLVLAAFNMVPGFPLDGGRVFRAALWHFGRDLRWATRWATRVGQGFGLLLVALGVLNAFAGNLTGGLWWFLIGLFLHGAATASYHRMIAQQGLQGQKIRDIMTKRLITVPPDITVERFIDDYLYRYTHDVFPVVAGERLFGCVGLKDVKAVPRERWPFETVGRIAQDCTDRNTIGPNEDAVQALELMQRSDNGRILVTEGGRVLGVLTLKDLLHRLALRTELTRSE